MTARGFPLKILRTKVVYGPKHTMGCDRCNSDERLDRASFDWNLGGVADPRWDAFAYCKTRGTVVREESEYLMERIVTFVSIRQRRSIGAGRRRMVDELSATLFSTFRTVALGSLLCLSVSCVTESASSRHLFVATAGELEAASPQTFSAERGSTQTSSRVAMGSHREQVRLLAEGYLHATVVSDINSIAAMFAGRPTATDTGQPSRSPEDIVEHHRTVTTNSALVDSLRIAIDRNEALINVRSLQEFRRQSATSMPWLQPGDWIINLNYSSLPPTMPPYSSQLFTVLVVRWTSSAPKVVGVSSLGPLRR